MQRPPAVVIGFWSSAFGKMLVAVRRAPDWEDSTSSDRVESSRSGWTEL